MNKYFFSLLASLVLVYCTPKKENTNSKLHVVTTTGMLYDAVINIGGDKLTSEYIMGPGVDPHLYKATQGDLRKLDDANLIVYNGIYLEGKMSEILEKLGKQKSVLAAAESLPKNSLLKLTGYDSYDPHIWFEIAKWKVVVQEISKKIIELDPPNEMTYNQNTDSYLKKLDELELYVIEQINEIPEEKRILITAHDAFEYFGNAYEIDVQGIQGLSTVSDFGLKDITETIDLIINRGINSVFVETSVSSKSINSVISGCREQGHNVSIGGSLYSDAMGELGTPEGTYIGMFKKNIDTIVAGLK